MRARFAFALLCLGWTGSALAQSTIPPVEPPGATPAKKREVKEAPELPPSLAFIQQGDVAFLARDFQSARALYQLAIKQDPQFAPAHLRMAQLHLSQGEVGDAAAVLQTALRFVQSEHRLKAQVYFQMAMIAEAEGRFEEARQAWNSFATFAQATAPGSNPQPHQPAPAPAATEVEAEPGQKDESRASALEPAAEEGPDHSEGSGAQKPPSVLRDSGAPPVFAGTVAARKEMMDLRDKAMKDAAIVRERIKKRFEEAQQASQR